AWGEPGRVSAPRGTALQGAVGGRMPNPYIPRDQVHAWSDAIGDNPETASLQRLLKQQRRLARWIEENAANLDAQSAGAALYLVGVVARIFDLAGGRLRSATW